MIRLIQAAFIDMENMFISFMNQRPNFESIDNLVNIMFQAKFSFTVENKMENSHRKEWSHFKLNIDLDN